MAFFLMSCGGSGQHPEDFITWGQAFQHVSHSFGYWLFVVTTTLLLAFVIAAVIKANKQGQDGANLSVFVFIALVLCLCAWFIRPSEIAANTTVEQAARGIFIGY